MKVIEVLETLKGYASKYKESGIVESVLRNRHMNNLSEKVSMTDEEAQAVIVDFINYVGVKNCVDYGLYTSDI